MSTKQPQTPKEPFGKRFYDQSQLSSKPGESDPSPKPRSKVMLRREAEARFQKREAEASEKLEALSPETLRTILHELRVHQIELEMQNEELLRTQEELDASRERYFDLYDLAPVGYMTVSEAGLILEANLTAAILLGLARPALVKQPVSRIIHKEDQDIYYMNRRKLLECGKPQQCELRLVKKDGTTFWAQLSSTTAQTSDGGPSCRITLSDITERKSKDEALRESENLLTQAQIVAGLGVYTLDFTTGFWKSSAIMDRVFGIGESYERSMAGWVNLVHPDDRAMMVDYFKNEVVGLGQPFCKEYRIVRHDDQAVRWLHGRGMLESDSDNRPLKMLGTIQDITERKQAEEELQVSHELLRVVLDSIPVRVFWKDKNLNYLGCNSAFAKDAGLEDPSEIIGRDDSTMPWKAQAELYRDDDRAVVESGQEKLLIEESLTTPSGKQIELLTNKIPLRNGDGAVTGVLGTYFDITERKRAEEEQITLRKAVEQSANAIVITDSKGKIEYVNPSFEKVTGYSMAELVGHNPRQLKSGQQDEAFYKNLWETITSGSTWRGNFQNRRKDGSLYWESATISPVLNDKGKIRHFIAIKEDITERKLMEDRLTASLLRAEAAAAAKSNFLSVMSHELRTPLNGILGFTELLSDTPLNEEQKFFAKTISSSGEHLVAIVNDILDFSSIEHDSLTIIPAPLTIAELVESSDTAIRQAATDKGIEFRCEVAAEVPTEITGDARRIRQILINLLGNALKFTQRGSIAFRIAPDVEGRFLEFSIADTGIGISAETLAGLFKPFTQANSTTSRPFGGTGLGLAISKRLAEAMGGSITVTSTLDKGSTFTFRLPLEKSPSKNPSALSPHAESESNSKTPPLNEKALILVVDDEHTCALLAGKMLQSLGFPSESANNGSEAVEAFEPGKFSAILMDMSMPGMGGLEATKNIRKKEPAGTHVPIIALTANVMPGDHEQCLAAGMDDVLTKPFKKDELAAKLARLTQQ